jgi:cytochrome c oxidase subunit 2
MKIFFTSLILSVGLIFTFGFCAESGKELFEKNCATCHGSAAEGNAEKKSPNLAGRPEWELLFHLERFVNGERPSAANDTDGALMKQSLSNLSAENRKAVVTYLSGLKPTTQNDKLEGNPKRGENLFALCASCHGANGKGNASLFAPKLSGVSGWYLLNQLQKFRTGVRGAPSDFKAYQMGLMVLQLPDEKALVDVSAYLVTLKP